MSDSSVATLAYAAAFVDGEGSIGATRRRTSVELHVQVVNTDRRVIQWFADNFGGNVLYRPSRREGQRDTYAWWMSGQKVVSFLRDLRPYMIVKPEQADLVLAWPEGDYRRGHKNERGSRIPEHILAERLRILTELQRLHHGI